MISGSTASAQSASNIINLFSGLVGTAITQATIAEWQRVRPDELQCIDQRLGQVGLSIRAAIQQGMMPNDPRLASARLACRNDIGLTSPSFDCTRATLPDERSICSNPELARLDRLASVGYDFVRTSKGEQMARRLAAQLLRYRRLCGANVDCIREAQLNAIKVYRENGAPIELPTEPVQQQSPSIYSVDGFALGGNAFQRGTYNEYSCKPSEQFILFTVCERKKAETIQRGKFTSTYILLYSQDGRVAYANRLLEPAWFSTGEAKDDIGRLTKKYRQQPNLLQMPNNREGLKGTIATWGELMLQPLSEDKKQALLNGREVKVGLLVDYLGNTIQSMQIGLPVYEIAGNSGFVWAASWDESGVGVLRFFAADTSNLNGSIVATKIDARSLKAQELKTKYEELLNKAKSGDADAALALSDAYLNGNGVDKNSAEAVRWLKVLVDKGDARAETKLASMMLEGNGIPRDENAALQLFKSAADKNNPEATYSLGNIYDRGQGVAVDSTEAFKWFERAASLGSASARVRIEEGQKVADAARAARIKLEDHLSSIKAKDLRQRVFEQSVVLSSANAHMSYADLVKVRASTETANRLSAELEDLDRISKLGDSLIKEVEARLNKITSDAPLIVQLHLSISDVQSAINSQQLEKLQSAMGNLSNLYNANQKRLHDMEFEAP
jgi:TPR repeat protein